jgi:5-methylcytosine-specific restriction endonuclease McrA
MKLVSNPCPWYEKAKASSRKRQVEWLKRAAVEAYIQQHYDSFDNTLEHFKVQPSASAKRRLDLLMQEFYLRPNSDLGKELHDRRHNHGLTECPYCGNPWVPDTLDHFLPKEDWPEYSILPNNLVPQCRSCAPIKGRRYYCPDELRAMFLHPMYNEALSSVRFKINVSLEGGAPKFGIEFSAARATSSDDLDRIVLHLSKLDVKRRMLEFCFRHWSHWREKVKTNRIEIEALFRLEIGTVSTDDYGRDWETAFKKGVLRDAKALAALNAKPPLPPVLVEPLVKLSIP